MSKVALCSIPTRSERENPGWHTRDTLDMIYSNYTKNHKETPEHMQAEQGHCSPILLWQELLYQQPTGPDSLDCKTDSADRPRDGNWNTQFSIQGLLEIKNTHRPRALR